MGSDSGGEARTAMDCFTRLAPNVERAQGIVYDTGLRGVHHQAVLRDLGLIPINRVTAAKTPRRKGGRRAPKSTYLEEKTIDTPNGTETISLYARDGALGIAELTTLARCTSCCCDASGPTATRVA